jgi:hypothetical protein
MAKKSGKGKFKDLLMRAFKAKDADEVEKLASEAESMDEESEEEKAAREKEEKEKGTQDALNQILKRLGAMDEDIQAMKKAQAEDDDETEEERKAREAKEAESRDAGDLTNPETAPKLDEAGVKLYTGDAAKQILPLAEILAPGIKLPTLDAKTTDAQRAQALCSCQRKALDTAYKTDDGKAVIDAFLGGQTADFATLPVPLLHAAFIGAANLMKARNNDKHTRVSVNVADFGKTTDVGTINTKNREFWAKRSGTHH